MNDYHIALTGHRPNRLDGYNLNTPFYDNLRRKLKIILEDQLKIHNHITAHSGLALGADTIWSEVIIEARDKYPNQLQFIAEIPCPEQANKWSQHDAVTWAKHVQHSDQRNVYSKTYTKDCTLNRNIGMIDNSDLLIAIWDGKPYGGTAHAVNYAKNQNKMIIQIHPNDI